MKKVLRKSNLVAGILILVVVCLGIVFAGDVIVKEGTLEAENIDVTGTIEGGSITAGGTIEGGVFKSTGCTATGTKAVAFGDDTEASGNGSTAMGARTTANGNCSTAMGYDTTAGGFCSTASGVCSTASGSCSTAMGVAEATGSFSTAMGHYTTASADFSLAFGEFCDNDIYGSFAVGYGSAGNHKVDFKVESGLVTVGDVGTHSGDLYVGRDVWANNYNYWPSPFYDKDKYGRALDYAEDSSKTVKLNAQGQKEYNHETDPEFLKSWFTVKDYDTYTEEEVWDDVLNETITRRTYQTHQELGTSLGMQAAWLRQCVFELKQENQMLKAELAELKAAVGIE